LQSPDKSCGKLYIVGTGPGDPDLLTLKAIKALNESSIVIGNDFYLSSIQSLLIGKTIIKSSMGKEVERAKTAVELAEKNIVSMVSGGDPGVYGMAGIVLEVLEHSGNSIPFEVIPGVTAATAAASRLGSPLSGDFAVISLSDLLVPWETIIKRLIAFLDAEVPLILYNPRSRGRPGHFAEVIEIVKAKRKGKSPVALVKNVYRDNEEIVITNLDDAIGMEEWVDMHTVVIIGGEETRNLLRGDDVIGIITPRGYQRKYVY